MTDVFDSDVAHKRNAARFLYPQHSPDEAVTRMEYRVDNGKELDLENPREIAEKLHWLKLNDHRALYGELVDKFAVRKFVAERAGEGILNECFGVFDDPDEILADLLPQSFVIKATHGYDMNVLCRDKSTLDWKQSRNVMSEWLSTRHELRHGEWAYSLVKPRLIAEAWMEEISGELSDYKFYCFNGGPRFFKIDRGRSTVRSQGHFDLDFTPMPFHIRHYAPLSGGVKPPPNFERMIEIATQLSDGIPFVRVDLYNLDGEIRFGEMTLYPCGGNLRFEPQEWNVRVGDMLELPRVQPATYRDDARR